MSIAELFRPFRAGLLGGLFSMGFTHRYNIAPLRGFRGKAARSKGAWPWHLIPFAIHIQSLRDERSSPILSGTDASDSSTSKAIGYRVILIPPIDFLLRFYPKKRSYHPICKDCLRRNSGK